MSFSDLFSLLLVTLNDGMALGLLYAVIALGYTMVYGVLGLINFAHSEIFMVGGIVGIEVQTYVLAGSSLHPIIQILLAILAGALSAGAVAVAMERVAYRPLRIAGAPRLVFLITAIGMSLFLQDAVRLVESLFGQFIRPFPVPAFFDRQIMFSDDWQFSYRSIMIFAVAISALLVLTHIVWRTRLGKAIRAVAGDAEAASLMGIDVNRVISWTFLIGGFLGGVAGVLFGLQFGRMDPFSGFVPGIKAFTAAVLGGIGSVPGAMLGGIVLGLLEVVIGTFVPILTDNAIGTEYKDIFAFLVLIAILIFRPAGLLGRRISEKV